MSDNPFGDGLFAGAATASIVLMMAFVFALAISDSHPASYWHAEAVKNGAGEYNAKTGKFQWVNVKPEAVCE